MKRKPKPQPNIKQLRALWDHCAEFIEDLEIGSAETVYQSDRVIEKAYEFIEGVCDVVGYAEPEDE